MANNMGSTNHNLLFVCRFSPDGSKFVIGMYWYLADGATAKVYETDTGLLVDTFFGTKTK